MKTYDIFGLQWVCAMEGNALINPHKSHWFYCEDCIKQKSNNEVELFTLNKKGVEIEDWEHNVYHPTYGSGVLRSVNDFSYGIFSADIKLPRGTNLWPAFWLTGSEFWPPEIDIFEAYSGKIFKDYINGFNWDIETNVHYKTSTSEHEQIKGKGFPIFKLLKSPTNNFVNYKVVWTPSKIDFFVNDKLIRTVTDKNILDYFNTTPHLYAVLSLEIQKDYTDKDLSKLERPMVIRNFNYIPFNFPKKVKTNLKNKIGIELSANKKDLKTIYN